MRLNNRKAYHLSAHIHATHDKVTLKERASKKDILTEAPFLVSKKNQDEGDYCNKTQQTGTVAVNGQNFLSNVCCQDVDFMNASSEAENSIKYESISAFGTAITSTETSPSHRSSSYFNPIPPPAGGVALRIGVLTVSDRCFTNQYKSGDLSGPAVCKSINSTVEHLNASASSHSTVSCDMVQRGVVPDEVSMIRKTLQLWSEQCNLIFTTGGTGFSPRDVTPEATLGILDRECHGLMTWAAIVCSSTQNLAPLSRGTAGIRGRCIIVNLPGSPSGSSQVTTLLLPLLIHAVKDMSYTA